jgi:DNA-binding transcriptional ArsR family regulator
MAEKRPTELVAALIRSMEKAAESGEKRGRKLRQEGEELIELGQSLIDQASQLQAGVAGLRGAEPLVRPTPQPTPPPVVVRSKRDVPPAEAAPPAVGFDVARYDVRGTGKVNITKVYEYLVEHGPSKLSDVMAGTGMSQTNTSRYLRLLIGGGDAVKTGVNINAWYMPAAQRAADPEPVAPEPEPEQEPEIPPTPEPTSEPTGDPAWSPRLRSVWDALVELSPAGLGQIVKKVGIAQPAVSIELGKLLDAGLATRTGTPGTPSAKWVRVGSPAAPGEKESADPLSRRIEFLRLPNGNVNPLRRNGVVTVGDVAAKSDAELLAMVEGYYAPEKARVWLKLVREAVARVTGVKYEPTELKTFTRKEYADALGLTALQVGRLLGVLAEKKIITSKDGVFTASEFADKITLAQRKRARGEDVEVPEPPTDPEPKPEPKPRPEPRIPTHTGDARLRETPPSPAPEPVRADGVPEHLAWMPAAQTKNVPLATKVKLAELQKRVCDFAHSQDTIVTGEVAAALDISKDAASKALDALEGAKLVRRTGVIRHATNREFKAGNRAGGRKSVEYAATELPTKDDKAQKATQIVKDSQAERSVLSRVEAFAAEQEGTFSLNATEQGTELPRGVVLDALERLVAAGKLDDESPGPDLRLFVKASKGAVTMKPSKAAEKAQMPEAARKARQEIMRNSKPTSKSKGPVAGTGKPLKVTDPDVRKLVEDCVKAGATVTKATNGHYAVEKPGVMKRALIAATPRGKRSVMNDRARLRKNGLPV